MNSTTRPNLNPTRSALALRSPANPLIAPRPFDPLRASQPRQTASTPQIDAETVIARLEEAGTTLLSLPRTGHSTALRQTRHSYISDAVEAFTSELDQRPRIPVPPAHRITRMDHALAWIPLIPPTSIVLRRIVGCRCLVSPLTERHLFSWRRLARLLGADHKAIQRWHATGIDLIVGTLNHDADLARRWDTLG